MQEIMNKDFNQRRWNKSECVNRDLMEIADDLPVKIDMLFIDDDYEEDDGQVDQVHADSANNVEKRRSHIRETTGTFALPAETTEQTIPRLNRQQEVSLTACWNRLKEWTVDNLYGCWCALVMFATFTGWWAYYRFSSQFKQTRSIMGETFPVARASAACISLSMALLLLTLCRWALTWLRHWPRFNHYFDWNDERRLHRVLGISVAMFSAIHTLAHLVNFYRVSLATTSRTFVQLLFTTGPAVTGWLALIVLVAVVGSLRLRRYAGGSYYQWFSWIHRSLVPFVFYLLIFPHGSFCMIRTDSGQCVGPQFWKYFIGPAALLAVDFTLRCWRRYRRPAHLISATLHPQRVIELQFKIVNSNSRNSVNNNTNNNNNNSSSVNSSSSSISCNTYRPGQYVYLMCADISRLQWHPFTISQCIDDGIIRLHIKVTGDWTEELLARFEHCQRSMEVGRMWGWQDLSAFTPSLYLDGPYAAPVQDAAYRHEACVLVAGGIGITPFIPLLQWFARSPVREMKGTRLRKLYLVWLARDAETFEWFHPVLMECEREAQRNGRQIELILHWTVKQVPTALVYNIALNDSDRKLNPDDSAADAVTGLQALTNYGRPRWEQLFERVSREQLPLANHTIGVYCCAASGNQLANQLSAICSRDCRFRFYQECF